MEEDQVRLTSPFTTRCINALYGAVHTSRCSMIRSSSCPSLVYLPGLFL